jgi:GT2 family glycosyltransferase
MKDQIIILGFLSHFPVAGVAWQTIHYLIGFQRLGFDVYYVEAHGCTPSKLMRTETDDGAACAAAYVANVMRRFGLHDQWAYHARYPESRYFGLSQSKLEELYRSATLIINLHGSHIPLPELAATGRLVYLETDPVEVEIDLFLQKQPTLDYLAPHAAFFTYGENLGQPDCLVPKPERFRFIPTRQPVIMDFWEGHGHGDATTFTTIGNWRQPWREVQFQGEVYRWSKHFEFRKFIDLPRRVRQPFELALSSYDEQDQRLLESHGWQVRPGLEISHDLDHYRRFIGSSRAEFTVAKDQNVRLRSGWFSDRAVTYLAAGRPVVTQETAFSNLLPTGEGLFAFTTEAEIIAAIDAINTNYDRQRQAAQEIAREYFSYEVVLGKLLRDLGRSRTTRRLPDLELEVRSENQAADLERAQTSADGLRRPGQTRIAGSTQPASLPASLALAAISRWPTRLPESTLRTALALPVPVARTGFWRSSKPARASEMPSVGSRLHTASIIVVTYNGLPYTKMCLTSLLLSGWRGQDQLIVVDNGSSDGTVPYLRELARLNPSVQIVFNERNRGFAAANNHGLLLATGEVLILLNNDTIVSEGWRDGLSRWLEDSRIGMVGPVTNHACNEARIDAPYRTYGEMVRFSREYNTKHQGELIDVRMLAMFCAAMRRDVFARIGLLDEQFEVGMFEDDDYCQRMRAASLRVVCVEDVFVHHFGQAAFGELCVTGAYDRVFNANRHRFETKWGAPWQPHQHRITPEYQGLRRRIRDTAAACLPPGATVVVISKGDAELVGLKGLQGWHFPQTEDGRYANHYPAHSAEAIAQLESLRVKGGGFLLIPKPALWWLDYYGDFKSHLENHCRLVVREEETCLIYDLGGAHV